jgi:transposase
MPISPMALEAVKRIDALFDIEREINGLAAAERLERRRKDSLPLVGDLHDWLQTERAKLSRSSPVAEAIDYMLKRWDGFTSFLSDGRICLTTDGVEKSQSSSWNRFSWLFLPRFDHPLITDSRIANMSSPNFACGWFYDCRCTALLRICQIWRRR